MAAGKRSPTFAALAANAKIAPAQSDPWTVAYFKRHVDDDPGQSIPAKIYIWDQCPLAVQTFLTSCVAVVAEAPPPKFAGGGYWEAMHGALTGFHEIRKKYRGLHYRLFCRLDHESIGTPHLLTLLGGMTKPSGETFSDAEYAGVLDIGEEYLGRNPRSIVI